MTTQTTDALVEGYLTRLAAAAWPLPADRREELLDGIREHIADARAAGATDEVAVRELLDRLGAPEEIAAAAAVDGAPAVPPYPVGPAAPDLSHETWTVCLLTVGNLLLPFFSWCWGAAMLLGGKRWTWQEKLLGLLVLPGGWVGSFVLLKWFAPDLFVVRTRCVIESGSSSCDGSGLGWLHGVATTVVFAVLLLGPIVSAWWLYRTAKRRAEAEPRQLAWV